MEWFPVMILNGIPAAGSLSKAAKTAGQALAAGLRVLKNYLIASLPVINPCFPSFFRF